jgi:3-beta hydroxysteroid dehydrogenase/isomerase family
LLVLVVGGTGYVGSHTIAALTRAGTTSESSQDLRIGSPQRSNISASTGVESAIGGLTESASVERALEGCDGVLHAASVFSTDVRKADEGRAMLVRGTDIVLGTAHRLGLGPVVHVSSDVALSLGRRRGPHAGFAGEAASRTVLSFQGRFRTDGPQMAINGTWRALNNCSSPSRNPCKYGFRRPAPNAKIASGFAGRWPIGAPGRHCRCHTRTAHAFGVCTGQVAVRRRLAGV